MRRPEDELQQLNDAQLRRRIPVRDAALTNFASNDYLGLSQRHEIKQAYHEAIDLHGSGATASRLICGTQEPHRQLESFLAEAKGTEAALSFSTGYATSVGTLTALLQKGDTVILDKLSHASLIDGARMSGATLRVFPHNHLGKLESLLASAQKKATAGSRILVVTESIFSMDGDAAPLRQISALTRKHNSLLLVDEAHGLGITGPTGMGLAEELGLQKDIDFHMGTLGKAAGVGGGYLAAAQVWIDLLINRARSFIYSTAPPPAQAAAALASLHLMRGETGQNLREQLWQNIRTFHQAAGIQRPPSSAIIPWLVGESEAALKLSQQLQDHGMLVPAIRYPTVPRNTARLRITICAHHQHADILRLANSLKANS